MNCKVGIYLGLTILDQSAEVYQIISVEIEAMPSESEKW